MNLSFLFKTTSVFLVVICFVITFGFVEAERSIRLRRKSRSHIAPKHISVSGGATYARRYSYGRPISSYTTKPGFGRNRRNFRSRRNGGRTYASGYKNWTPNRNFNGGRNNPRADNIKLGHKKRKERFPVTVENFGGPKQKRRIRPYRGNPIQRPFPPKNEFEDEYYFPEESKRGEYEFENRFPRPKKKRRNPGDVEKIPKKPDFFPKIPYYDEKPFKKVREPPISYSSFIQHPHSDAEDLYEDPDIDHYAETVRNKKKRVKKKTSSKKKNKDEEYYRPFAFEKDEKPDSYPPYSSDEYELPAKTTKKGNKIKFDLSQHDSKFEYSKPRPQVNNLFSSSEAESHYNNFRGSSKVQETSFNPTYSQSWSSIVETTARPVQYQTETPFQPQYNYQNRDYSSSQKTKTVTNSQQATYYSQPDNTYKNLAYNYVSNQVSTNTQPAHYNSVYSNQQSPTYSQPAPVYSQPSPTYSQASSSYSQPLPTYSQPVYASDISVQKSVPIYDNTETFYNFNNNAYVNSQSSKYNVDSQKYSNRLSTYKDGGDKSEADEFIQKHQNLYNNGLAGIPVQGDGYAKENVKKDYDIGYGDFQFDENPTT